MSDTLDAASGAREDLDSSARLDQTEAGSSDGVASKEQRDVRARDAQLCASLAGLETALNRLFESLESRLRQPSARTHLTASSLGRDLDRADERSDEPPRRRIRQQFWRTEPSANRPRFYDDGGTWRDGQ